jgi:hypothetical protein
LSPVKAGGLFKRYYMDIQHLDLTEQDFQLIIDGLDELPNKGAAGDIMFTLLGATLAGDNPEAQAKIKAEADKKARAEKASKEQLKEDIRILQGKLLSLKRWLITQGALKQVNDILSPGK